MFSEDFVPNPPWVDRVLSSEWPRLEEMFGPDLLPRLIRKTRSGKMSFTEYGTGHYGTVFPTGCEGYVFKVSSDPTEAAFIVASAQIPPVEGIVKYLAVFETRHRYRDRPVYVIAREGADSVGGLGEGRVDRQQMALERRVLRRLWQFKTWASVARSAILGVANPETLMAEAASPSMQDWASDAVDYGAVTQAQSAADVLQRRPPLRGARRVAYAAKACEYIAQEMGQEDVGYLIGQALEHYIDHGILLADVHGGNVGQVEREDYSKPIWVITDPGHMVPLNPKWTKIQVPEL